MEFVHTGLAVSSEENADGFYRDLLGLEKLEPKTLPEDLIQALFGISEDLTVINYKSDALHVEIFVYPSYKAPDNLIAHECVKVIDLDGFVAQCKDAGFRVLEVPKGQSAVIFVSDFDGNLFEIKKA